MSNTLPPLHTLPVGWPDAGPGVSRAAPAATAAPVEWFGPRAAARTLSAQPGRGAGLDVDAWARSLVNHLLEPDTLPR